MSRECRWQWQSFSVSKTLSTFYTGFYTAFCSVAFFNWWIVSAQLADLFIRTQSSIELFFQSWKIIQLITKTAWFNWRSHVYFLNDLDKIQSTLNLWSLLVKIPPWQKIPKCFNWQHGEELSKRSDLKYAPLPFISQSMKSWYKRINCTHVISNMIFLLVFRCDSISL